MYTAILVDDMPEALKVLEKDIAVNFPDINIIGKAESVVAAAKLLRDKQPDLLFLDIMLGDGTGFDLLEIFPDLQASVIFITATDEFAIKAFRFAAVDYLLKPLNTEELLQAIRKATQQVNSSKESLDLLKETINNPSKLPTKISLHSQDKISVVDINQIVRCESDGNNTLFHMIGGEKLFVTKTLKSYDTMLADHHFKRVHQSHLINIEYIQEYTRRDGGALKMKNGDSVPISIRKKAEVIEMLDHL